jgi:hypothetical protein
MIKPLPEIQDFKFPQKIDIMCLFKNRTLKKGKILFTFNYDTYYRYLSWLVKMAASSSPLLGPHQEKGVHHDVELQRREYVARVVVAPEAYLDRDYDGRVDEEGAAQKQHHCNRTHGHLLASRAARAAASVRMHLDQKK